MRNLHVRRAMKWVPHMILPEKNQTLEQDMNDYWKRRNGEEEEEEKKKQQQNKELFSEKEELNKTLEKWLDTSIFTRFFRKQVAKREASIEEEVKKAYSYEVPYFPRRGFFFNFPVEYVNNLKLNIHWITLSNYQRKWEKYDEYDRARMILFALEIDSLHEWQRMLESPSMRRLLPENVWQARMQWLEEQKVMRVKAVKSALPSLKPYAREFPWVESQAQNLQSSGWELNKFYPDQQADLEDILEKRKEGKFHTPNVAEESVKTELVPYDMDIKPREAIKTYFRNIPRIFRLWKEKHYKVEDFTKLNDISEVYHPMNEMDTENPVIMFRFPVRGNPKKKLRLKRRIRRRLMPKIYKALIFQEPALVFPFSTVHVKTTKQNFFFFFFLFH